MTNSLPHRTTFEEKESRRRGGRHARNVPQIRLQRAQRRFREAAVNAEAAPLTAARKKRGRWVVVGAIVALVAVVGVVVAMTLGRPSGSATSNLSTATAAKRTITVAVSGTGSAVAADAVTVNPQITGEVEKLYVSLGASVAAGDRLYTISSSDVENELLKAKASLLQSEQSVLNARSSYKQASSQLYSANTQKLKAQQSVDRLKSEPTTATDHAYNLKVAKRELASAKQSVSSASVGVSSAEVGLEAAKANLTSAEDSYGSAKDDADETVVTAPSDGVITALPISVGSAVSAGTNSSASSSAQGRVRVAARRARVPRRARRRALRAVRAARSPSPTWRACKSR